MDKGLSHYLLVIALWLITSLPGCATSGDLDALKLELQQSIVDKTAPIEPLKVDTKSRVDDVQNAIAKLSQSLKEQNSKLTQFTQALYDIQQKVNEFEAKSENLVKEREKVHAALQLATRRILQLFKAEEAELKDRIRFLQAGMKEFEAEEPVKK